MNEERNELNRVSGYLYFIDVPGWNAETCPKCGGGISANWVQGHGYYYCVEGCELSAHDIKQNNADRRD